MTDWHPPLVLFASTLVFSPCPVEAPCTPMYMDQGYTIIIPYLYHSRFLATFVAGDIKYFRIGGGAAPGGRNILNIFSSYTHLLVLLDKSLKIS